MLLLGILGVECAVLSSQLVGLREPLWSPVPVTPMDLLATSAAVVVLVLTALALSRPPRPDRSQQSTLRAHTLFERLARGIAPAATAGLVFAFHTGRAMDSLVVVASMLAASRVLHSRRYPLHLVRLARIAFDVLMPLIGIGLAVVANVAVTGESVPPDAALLALGCTWVVTFIGGWLEAAFDAERPIRLALVGDPALATALRDEIAAAGVTGHTVAGCLLEEDSPSVLSPGIACLGTVADARKVVQENSIDMLVLSPLGSRIDLFRQISNECIDLPVRMIEASAVYEELHGRVPIGRINSAWFQYMMHPRFKPGSSLSKRTFDLVVSIALAVFLLPLIATLALLVRLQDGGPALYRQRRVGESGRDFDVLKLRSMRIDAEQGGATWAQEDDERITKLGGFMRKTHLDELPQLWNVIRGDMSLVGPRPERPEFVQELESRVPFYQRRHLVKPGVTGWAQVHCGYSGSDAGTAFKLSHDLYYVKHRSILFDVLIIVETLRTFVADPQFATFTFSEAFILGHEEIVDEVSAFGDRAVLGDTARLASERRLFEEPPRKSA